MTKAVHANFATGWIRYYGEKFERFDREIAQEKYGSTMPIQSKWTEHKLIGKPFGQGQNNDKNKNESHLNVALSHFVLSTMRLNVRQTIFSKRNANELA